MLKRVVQIKFNVSTGDLLDFALLPINVRELDSVPFITFSEYPLLRLCLYQSDTAETPVPYEGFAGLSSFSFAVDADWDHDTAPMVREDNDSINLAGDWEGGGTADPDVGQFSIRVNANIVRFIEVIQKKQRQLVNLQIKGFWDGLLVAITPPIPVVANNILDNDGDPPEEVQSSFYDKGETDSRIGTSIHVHNTEAEAHRNLKIFGGVL